MSFDFTYEELKTQSDEDYQTLNLDAAVSLIKNVKPTEVALDFETTALFPNDKPDARVRITSICCSDFHFIIDHDAQVWPKQSVIDLLEALHEMECTVYVYNAKFETTWIDYYLDSEKLSPVDVDFLAKVKLGGGHSSLAVMCKRDLGISLDKEEQNSDWGAKVLSPRQLSYAAFDSFVTWELVCYWLDELTDEQLAAVSVFNDAVRATTDCEAVGLFLEEDTHIKTISIWRAKQRAMERYLRKFTGPELIENLRSDVQIGKYLRTILDKTTIAHWPKTTKKRQLQFESKYLREVAGNFPYPFNRWLYALARFKYYNKYLSTYGDTLITIQSQRGRVTSRYNMAQAVTGRYSSSSINKQNIPRKTVVRAAFRSDPDDDEILLLADYKGVEIRVLGEISGDERLLEDATYADVHAASASAIYGIEEAYVTEVLASDGTGKYANVYSEFKEKRSKAKAFTFQLLYGAGPAALAVALSCSYDEAVDAIRAWAGRYERAYNYRTLMNEKMVATGFLPVCDGRTMYVPKPDRSMPVAANYPVQGAAGSVMYRALYRVREEFNKNQLDCMLAANVHDEILSSSSLRDAEAGMKAQIRGMEQGWLDIFPGSCIDNLVDHKIGHRWSDKP